MTKARSLASAANSAVNSTELGYLDGVTSAIQTQLNNKQAVVSGVDDTEIGYLNGVTSAIQTQLDAKAPTSTTVTLTGTQTLTSKTLTNPVLAYPEENLTINTGAPFNGTQTINIISDNSLYYFTGNSTNNWTLNIRGDGSNTLASMLAVGQSLTFNMLVTNSSTAYYQTGFQIDGTSVTPKWSGGTAPASGNASSIDAYSFTIIKTAATPTYTVLGAGPVKYA